MEKRQKEAIYALTILAVLLIMGFITYFVREREKAATGAFEDELQRLTLSLAETEEYFTKKLKENEDLARVLKLKEAELLKASGDLRAVLAEVALKTDEIEELEIMIKKKSSRLVEKSEEVKRQTDKIALLEAAQKEMGDRHEKSQRLIAGLEERLAKAMRDNADLENALLVLRQKQAAADREITDKASRLEIKEQALDAAGEEIVRLADSLAQIQQAAADRISAQNSLQAELAETKKHLAETRERLAGFENRPDNREVVAAKTLTAKQADIELLLKENAGLRSELQAIREKKAAAKNLLPQLALALGAEKGVIIATVNFSTGSWKLDEKQRRTLSGAISQAKELDQNAFYLLLKGKSDRQKFSRDHGFRNLELSALRSLAVSRIFLSEADKLPPLVLAGESDVFASEPEDNPDERTVHVFLAAKKNLDPRRILALIEEELN